MWEWIKPVGGIVNAMLTPAPKWYGTGRLDDWIGLCRRLGLHTVADRMRFAKCVRNIPVQDRDLYYRELPDENRYEIWSDAPITTDPNIPG